MKISDLLFKTPIYEKVSIQDIEGISSAEELADYQNPVEGHCKACDKERVFFPEVYIPERNKDAEVLKLDDILVILLRCSNSRSHQIFSSFLIFDDDNITKIGQFPSIADLAYPEIKKYGQSLGKYRSEFSKAIGLFSHGIGVGSYVYLRRIFEFLIEDAYTEAQSQNLELSHEDFYRLRIIEKVELLQPFLPESIISFKQVYSVLSKGLHELSEEECIENFELCKTIIEIILDERIERLEKVRKLELAKKHLGKITNRLGENKDD